MAKPFMENSPTSIDVGPLDLPTEDRPLLHSNRLMEETFDRQNFYEKKASRLEDAFHTCNKIRGKEKLYFKRDTGENRDLSAPQELQGDISKNSENKSGFLGLQVWKQRHPKLRHRGGAFLLG